MRVGDGTDGYYPCIQSPGLLLCINMHVIILCCLKIIDNRGKKQSKIRKNTRLFQKNMIYYYV